MLMNMFDIFDLDDDGLLSRREFEAYSILSGSGPVSEQVINAQQSAHPISLPHLFLFGWCIIKSSYYFKIGMGPNLCKF
jgi:hypothetical protein